MTKPIFASSVLTAFFLLAMPAAAGNDKPLEVSIQNITAKGEALALGALLKYIEPINETEFEKAYCGGSGEERRCGYHFVTPEFQLNLGEDGLFQAINGKLGGEFMYANSSIGSDGFVNIGVRHVFPFSVGAETTRFADTFAVLGEVGYVPYKPGIGSQPFDPDSTQFDLGINPKLGLYFQGGYKFNGNSGARSGGAEDESSEANDSDILRVKAEAEFTLILPDFLPLGGDDKPQLISWARGWYDIANDDFYHSIGATLRLDIPTSQATFMDLTFENGSGAPNFNQGSQFSAGLTIAF